MSGERHGPKDEPSFDTQALAAVSDSELGQARPSRQRRGSKPPWGVIGGVAAAVLLLVVVAMWMTSGGPEVESVAVEPATSVSAAPDPTEPPPVRSASPVASAPARSVAPVAVPAPSPVREEPRSAGSKPARPAAAGGGADEPAIPDLDRALEKLSSQSGDELAAAGNAEQARAAYERECEGDRTASCVKLGAMRREGQGGASDAAGAHEAYAKACRKRSIEGCMGLAAVTSGRDMGEALEAACDLGSVDGCTRAAERIEGGAGPEARAIALRARACELGDKASCAADTTATSSTP